jgi:hypothetical protein
LVFNGPEALAVSVRDKHATTGRSTYTLGWSKPRALHELQNGRRFRTYPPGLEREIDWSDPYTVDHFDVGASALVKFVPGPRVPPILASRQVTVGIEILDGEVSSPPDVEANAPAATPVSASAQWAMDATRNLRAKRKIPEHVTQAGLARLLEAEARKAHKRLKASYLENQLRPWGIWPINSFE